MIIQFTVGNFKSFKEKATLSMVKTALHELPENVVKIDEDFELLKSAAIYGANASGKSNLIRALSFMKFFTIFSSQYYQPDEKIGINSFLLNEETKEKPSFFELIFIIDNISYRYGFEVNNERVNREWLYHIPKTREEKLFVREDSKFDLSEKFLEWKDVENKTRKNCLFLPVSAQFNNSISTKIIKWFKKIRIGTSNDYQVFLDRTIQRMEKDPSLREDVIRFISIADDGIDDLEIESIDIPVDQIDKNIPQNERKDLKRKLIYFVHKVFNADRQISGKTKLKLNSQESEGTKKMFAFSVPIIDAIRKGEIIVIDELENHLHPLLLKYIIKLFNANSNKNNAQLIFTTHNLTCMSKECFRRDQIWFTEKNSLGESTLFSLADYKLDDKKVRNDASYSKDYLLGKYGAVPFIDDIILSFKDKGDESSE